ncbi:hypothetical protein L0F63_000507 [Massospora cicadina]|nr:hypothetical protein L0F63_000507 [Massospora cicadina]
MVHEGKLSEGNEDDFVASTIGDILNPRNSEPAYPEGVNRLISKLQPPTSSLTKPSKLSNKRGVKRPTAKSIGTAKPQGGGTLKRSKSAPASKKLTDLFDVRRTESKWPPSGGKPSPPQSEGAYGRYRNESCLPISSSYDPSYSNCPVPTGAYNLNGVNPENEALICFICSQRFDEVGVLETHVNRCLERGVTTSEAVTSAPPSSASAMP